MKNQDFFKGKKVTVVGLARSGFCCARLLARCGASVTVTDQSDSDQVRQYSGELSSEGVFVELGTHSFNSIRGRDICVVSPGVRRDAQPALWATEAGIPVISEIEVGFLLCPAPIIAVTGSNGKTTVTTLIGKTIEAWGRRAVVCGNIGDPFTGEVADVREEDFVCLEVSSFQLETVRAFKPYIAVMLNLNRNHLDRHADMNEYREAKKRIFLNQGPEDHVVVNSADPSLADGARSRVSLFSGGQGMNPNGSAVSAVASILGIQGEIVRSVLNDFRGLEHRMETAARIRDITFINDSKATTAESCAWALSNLSRPVILIAGGRDKGADYSVIVPLAATKVSRAILIGEAGPAIGRALESVTSVSQEASLEQAVRSAFETAEAGATILLSPMCSSFDMFKNYEHRGRAFKEIVMKLKKEVESTV